MVKDTFETEIIPDTTPKGINKSVVAYRVLGIKQWIFMMFTIIFLTLNDR
jgi:hypothetical protein